MSVIRLESFTIILMGQYMVVMNVNLVDPWFNSYHFPFYLILAGHCFLCLWGYKRNRGICDAYHDNVIKWKHFRTLYGELTGHLWFPSQRPVTQSLDKRLVNNRDTGNLRRHCAHNDVTIMICITGEIRVVFPTHAGDTRPCRVETISGNNRIYFHFAIIYYHWDDTDN